MDQAVVIAKVRDLMAMVTGIAAAYSAADTDDTRVPAGLNQLPAALVLPGPTLAYIVRDGQHRHTYEVLVQVLEAGGDLGVAAATLSVMPDRVLAAMLSNVALGGLCNSFVFTRSQGLQGFEYGGTQYAGYELVFEVSEQSAAAPGFGS